MGLKALRLQPSETERMGFGKLRALLAMNTMFVRGQEEAAQRQARAR